MNSKSITRRRFISRSALSSLSLTGFALIHYACSSDKGKEQKPEQNQKPQQNPKPEQKKTTAAEPCEDFSGLTEADLAARKKLGYVKASPISDSKCKNCQLFLPQKATPACGKCQLFKGPVLVGGYCTYWAPQIAG